jgi:hypothetical protein
MPTVNPFNVARPQLVEAKNMSFPNWVMISRASELTGYSEDAIRHKVKNGTWAQGRVWRKTPDGRIAINMTEYDKWAESAPQEAA